MNTENTENTENISANENQSLNVVGEETLSVYAGMNEVFEHTRQIIDTMKQGEKIGIRDLVDKVAAKVDMSGGNVMGLVQLFCKRSKEVSVEVGRGGGVFKGSKPRRIDARPRCETCHQVVRGDLKKKTSDVCVETDATTAIVE